MGVEIETPPIITLTMHQLAKVLARTMADYAIMTDGPFNRAAARLGMRNGLAQAFLPPGGLIDEMVLTVLPELESEKR